MPELPEVQTVVDTLRPLVLERRVARVEHLRADVVHPCHFDLAGALSGRTLSAIARRAKRIVFTLDDGRQFYVHLGMTGRLTTAPPSQEVAKHTHMILTLEPGGVQLRFRDPRRFGGIFWVGDTESVRRRGRVLLGPEPLQLRPDRLQRLLLRTRRAIKSALLDQRLIAGLGNIYVDESLFRAGIHPSRRCDELSCDDVWRLNRAIKLTLRRAIRHRGSTLRDYVDANGSGGRFQLLHCVYNRAGEPCRCCRTPIERIVLGGRSTHFCPRCQPPRRRARGSVAMR